eukprot:jgi/Picsp_1/2394/NSC_05855-R1_-dihydroxy-2-naphthoate chloroplastic-like
MDVFFRSGTGRLPSRLAFPREVGRSVALIHWSRNIGNIYSIKIRPRSHGSSDELEIISPDGIIGPDGEVLKRAPMDPQESRRLWKAAIKLPMYSVGIAPVLVSAVAAFVTTGALFPLRTLNLCLSAFLIIAWLNLSNDVFDSATGVDETKVESVVNLTGDWKKVFAVANPNILASRAIYAAICFGYLYQGPPFRWSYLGLGEPLCFLAFGPLATNAFYLSQIPAQLTLPTTGANMLSVIPSSMWALSTFVGLSTTIILFCSHFHQIEGDKKAGKMSPLVRMGIEQGISTLKFLVGCIYTGMLVLAILGILPFAVWTSGMISYGFASEMVKFAESERDNPGALRNLKYLATRWHIIFSSMLILGLIVAKLMVI